jgi:hypothetical protein
MGSTARWKLSADHSPLLQLADDFYQHLLRDDIERTEPTESPAVRSVTEAGIRLERIKLGTRVKLRQRIRSPSRPTGGGRQPSAGRSLS